MTDLAGMLWIETRKALRSGMPVWTALGSLFMPASIAFLIFVARNPEISQKLGLVSAKANLVAYSATDWALYLSLAGQIIAAGGLVFTVLIISWVFGREFVDGTAKDLLAVPIPRSSILLAKFLVTAIWSAVLLVIIFAGSLVAGFLLHLPGGTANVFFHNSLSLGICAGLTIVVVLPFALVASMGRGYLPPIGVAVLILMLTNLVGVIGWGEYFPWAIPGLVGAGKMALAPVSLVIVLLTGLVGVLLTIVWWKNADQDR